MKYKNKYPIKTASAKAGMCNNTGSKYILSGKLPSEHENSRSYRTRPDYFAEHWTTVSNMLEKSPSLQAKIILAYLIEQYPSRYGESRLELGVAPIRKWPPISGKKDSRRRPLNEVFLWLQNHIPQDEYDMYQSTGKAAYEI